MLLAVEGGGFFSSSASGYTNGLALLLLGRRNEERPMRVSPWNQYQLVEQDVYPDPLASKKKQPSWGCTSFICFNCSSEGVDGPSPPMVSSQQSETSSAISSDKGKGTVNESADETKRKVLLKSSLKKPSLECSVSVEGDDARDSVEEMHSNTSCCTQRMKVHWTDASGLELAEIREFEHSDEYASDDDFEHGQARKCECVIQEFTKCVRKVAYSQLALF